MTLLLLLALLAPAEASDAGRARKIEALAAAARPGAASITEADLLAAEHEGQAVFAVRRGLGEPVIVYLPALRSAGAHPRADVVARWRALGAVVERADLEAALARRRR